MHRSLRIAVLAAAVLAAGCASVPSGPRVMALPGSTKTFDQFRADDWDCRQYASVQTGGSTPDQAATDSGVRSAVTGTALGAAAGAAIDGGSGAAVGAGVGLLVGALAGSSYASGSAYDLQQRYDHAYTQCMYARGHKVPTSARFTSAPARAPAGATTRPLPPPPGSPPPPPVGSRPPPPPGAPPPPPPS